MTKVNEYDCIFDYNSFMRFEKYISEVEILKDYVQYFCKSKHNNQEVVEVSYNYQNIQLSEELILCSECLETIEYSIQRLQNCQYDEKPRCRNCKTPCYEKNYWKKLAKVMIYSSLRLKLTHFVSKLKLK